MPCSGGWRNPRSSPASPTRPLTIRRQRSSRVPPPAGSSTPRGTSANGLAPLAVQLHHGVHGVELTSRKNPATQMLERSAATQVPSRDGPAVRRACGHCPCAVRWLQPGAVIGGRHGGVARAAADPLPQAGQFGHQGSALAAELVDLLLLGQDERSGLRWPQQPIRIRNPDRRRAHHRRSLPKMQPEIKLLSRVQQVSSLQ